MSNNSTVTWESIWNDHNDDCDILARVHEKLIDTDKNGNRVRRKHIDPL